MAIIRISPQRGDTLRDMSRPVGAFFLVDVIGYKYVAPLGLSDNFMRGTRKARGIEAKPPATACAPEVRGGAGDVADSPTRGARSATKRLAQRNFASQNSMKNEE